MAELTAAERRMRALRGAVTEIEESKTANENRFSYANKAKLAELGIEKYVNKVGTNALFILPSSNPDLPFFQRVYYHQEAYKTGGAKRYNYQHVLCLDKMYGKPCPVCEAGSKPSVPDALKADFRYTQRFLMFVASYAKGDDPKKVYYLDCPTTLHGMLLDLIRPSDAVFGDGGGASDITDPTDFNNPLVFTFKYTKAQNGAPASYSMPKFVPIPKSMWFTTLPDTWKGVPELASILKKDDYDSIYEAWSLDRFSITTPPLGSGGDAQMDEQFEGLFGGPADSEGDPFAGFGQEEETAEDFTSDFADADEPATPPDEAMQSIESDFEASMSDTSDQEEEPGGVSMEIDNPFG